MKTYLTEKEEQSVERIVGASNAFDGSRYSAPLDADMYYLSCHNGQPVAFLAAYLMGDTVCGRPVEELLVFTHPDYRRHGRGKKLLRRYLGDRAAMRDTLLRNAQPPVAGGAANNQAGDVFPVLRFSAYSSAVSAAFFAGLGAAHSHDEVLMSRHLGSNKGKKLKEQEFRVENKYSECSVKTYGTVGYIYGVRTDSNHLRKGSAESLLNDVFAKLYDLGAEDAVLEVSSANIPAYHLYQKLKFEVKESLQIWHIL